MKHWIVVGICVIVGTVVMFRSRITPTQTVYTPTTGTATTQGIAWPPTSRITRDAATASTWPSTRGVSIQSLPNLRIATTKPTE